MRVKPFFVKRALYMLSFLGLLRMSLTKTFIKTTFVFTAIFPFVFYSVMSAVSSCNSCFYPLVVLFCGICDRGFYS